MKNLKDRVTIYQVAQAAGVSLATVSRVINKSGSVTESTRRKVEETIASLDEVPTHAATMGVKTVMHARAILLLAFGSAKAEAVRAALTGPVTEEVPASVLQLHPDVTVICDEEAAKLL